MVHWLLNRVCMQTSFSVHYTTSTRVTQLHKTVHIHVHVQCYSSRLWLNIQLYCVANVSHTTCICTCMCTIKQSAWENPILNEPHINPAQCDNSQLDFNYVFVRAEWLTLASWERGRVQSTQ